MKKLRNIFLLSLTLLFLFQLNANADFNETEQSIADEAGVNDIENSYLDKDELSGDKSINIFQKSLDIITDVLSGEASGIFGSFGLIMAVIVLCCVMHAMKFGGSEGLDIASGFISVIVLSGVTYSVLYNLFVLVIAAMESLSLSLSSLMPVMASLYAFGGNASAGAAAMSGMSIFLTVLSLICTKIIMPLLQISFALCLSGAMPGSVNLSSVSTLVRNTATIILSFLFTLLGFALYLQTVIASAGDSFINRSVRFASGVFVPVIGGMLGDASRTVAASVSVIKGTAGAAGVVIILSIVLPPIIITLLYKLVLLLCAVTARALNCDRESAFLYDIGGVLNILLALVTGSGVVGIIAMAVFVKVGVNV